MSQQSAATDADKQLQQFDTVVHMTPIRRRAMILIALGEFLDGYDLISIAGALLLHGQFHMTPSQTGLLGPSAFFGAAVGLLIAGAVADRIGRRIVFVHNFWLFVVLSLLAAFVANYTQLLIVRALLGVAIGADIATSMTLLGEISPRHSRGGWTGAVPQIAWTIGALSSLGVAIILINLAGPVAWRWLFGLGAVPALVILIGRRTLPESPRWLLSRGRTAEAAAAMRLFGIEEPARAGTPPAPAVPSVAQGAAVGSYLDIFRAPQVHPRAIG
ncbi:MAG TPA: MFS transporter [Acetobacteraceae bacterium]|jgi:putative MFS transporter